MKVLFVMPYPGYLRMYGSTVALLADRGHDVYLSYDNADKREDVKQLPSGVRSKHVIPAKRMLWKRTVWTELVLQLRLTTDYLRYLDPKFAHAPYLRKRMQKFLPNSMRFLSHVGSLPPWAVKALLSVSRWVEQAIPTAQAIDRQLERLNPDIVVVTPVVTRGEGGVRQTETVKSAKRLGVPVGIAVGSWDHLSSKGILHVEPDALFVWNDVQKEEAFELHAVRPEKVVVTGAQLFDQWFAKTPTVSRETFLTSVGLQPTGDPVLLYVGSSRSIAPPTAEVAFVRRWISGLRQSGNRRLEQAGILIRPHPFNIDHWSSADLSDLGNVAVWPRQRPSFPMNDADEMAYFHSLYFSDAVIGVNTSAMIEAAIVGSPVYTIESQEFTDTQDGTVHFHYLLSSNGGCVRRAKDLAQHVDQLADLFESETTRQELQSFVRSFVRPHGLTQPCTPILVDAIERLARRPRSPETRAPLGILAARPLLMVLAAALMVRPMKTFKRLQRGVVKSYRLLTRAGGRQQRPVEER